MKIILIFAILIFFQTFTASTAIAQDPQISQTRPTTILETLNGELVKLLVPFNRDTTKSEIVFKSLLLLPKAVKEVEATVAYSKTKSTASAALNLNGRYANPLDGVNDPTVNASAKLDFDLVKYFGQDALNRYGDIADKFILEFAKNYGQKYAGAMAATAKIADRTSDPEGLKSLALIIDVSIDFSKLPLTLPIEEELMKKAHIELSVSRTSIDALLNGNLNSKYKGFNQNEMGLKEWLEALINQDPEKLATLKFVIQMIDQTAEGFLN